MMKFNYLNESCLKRLKGFAIVTSFAFLGVLSGCQKNKMESEMKQDVLEMQYDDIDKVMVKISEDNKEKKVASDEAMVKLVDSLSILANDDGVYKKIVRGEVKDKDYEVKYKAAERFVEDNYYDVMEAYLMNMVKGKIAATLGMTDANQIKIISNRTALTGNLICNYVDSKTGLEYPIEILEGVVHGELSQLIDKIFMLQEKEEEQKKVGKLKDVKKMLDLVEDVYQHPYVESNKQGVFERAYTKLGGKLELSLYNPGRTMIRRK